MIGFGSRSSAKRGVALALAMLVLSAGIADAQSRRRSKEPEPPPAPLPEISEQAGRCSFAFHEALSEISRDKTRDLGSFEVHARVAEADAPGRWLFWAKPARNGKVATSEQVCAETARRGGRDRCLKWENRRLEDALVGLQPNGDELKLLRGLDGFVADKAAALEFGPNGRQYVTFQRVSAELASYIGQPRHPALCSGVAPMLEFMSGNLAGLQKRIDDVGAVAGRSLEAARRRVIEARQQRVAEAEARLQAQRQAATLAVAADGNDAASKPQPAVVEPARGPVPADALPETLIVLAVEGLLSKQQHDRIAAEPALFGKLRLSRELVTAQELPDASPAARAAAGAALRMIEAAVYAEIFSRRMARFRSIFLGTIDAIRAAHAAKCTCGED